MTTATSPGLREVELGPASLDRFRTVLSDEQWQRFQRAAARARRDFAGRVVWNVNSTARGGGVAELLASLVPYSRAAGVDVRWVVIEGDPAFFRVTKRLHNLLHGMPGDGEGLSAADEAAYPATSERNARALIEAVRPATSSCCTTRRPPDSWSRCGATACGSCGAATSAPTWQTTSSGVRGPSSFRTSRMRTGSSSLEPRSSGTGSIAHARS